MGGESLDQGGTERLLSWASLFHLIRAAPPAVVPYRSFAFIGFVFCTSPSGGVRVRHAGVL